jgi:hypothetical protein
MQAEKQLEKWVGIALVNLSIVALLGVLLRCKQLFPLPFIQYKYLLHAHSHFAFGGWISLALLALMIYRLLPAVISSKPVYQQILYGILISSLGMLISFPFQGYALFSIIFSMLFIVVTYWAAFILIRDLGRAELPLAVRTLAVSALMYLVLSSVGPFLLAFLMASGVQNAGLYNNSIYTYLHLQYNGFFTLGIFALAFHVWAVKGEWFAFVLNVSVLPSMCIAYLWNMPGFWITLIAIAGALLLLWSAVSLLRLLPIRMSNLMKFSILAFFLKQIFLAVTIVPSIGALVFYNRPAIIGFLHLVLLGFVTLYLLAEFIRTGLMRNSRFVLVFLFGILLNELVLFLQGLGTILGYHSYLFQWGALAASILLLGGAVGMWFYRSFFPKILTDNSNGMKIQQSIQATE